MYFKKYVFLVILEYSQWNKMREQETGAQRDQVSSLGHLGIHFIVQHSWT